MRTEQEIKDRLKWLLKAVDDEENQNEITQSQLWQQIDFIKWLLNDLEKFGQWCRVEG